VINIFFVPGTFGSTVEYVLRSHTKEYSIEPRNVASDGSMHNFKKLAHFGNFLELQEYLENHRSVRSICNTIYPFEHGEFDEILEVFKKHTTSKDQNILIYCDGFEFAEQNMLFQYYKIAVGKVRWPGPAGLEIFGGNENHNFVGWNPDYKTWQDLRPWEFREWFSMYYPGLISKWINSVDLVDNTFLTVSGNDILYNTAPTLLKIIEFCNLTVNKDLTPFVEEWQSKQQYILQEYKMLSIIVDCTVKKQPYTWPNLNIIAESIVQQKLRQQGFEIQCDGLNIFPTDSLTLHALLQPAWRTE
jgi:hypothetical protein